MSDNRTENTAPSNGSVAVIIPCYNEAVTIEKVVKDFRRVLPQASVYVYDNNSTDNTSELARNAGAIVRREPRQGKGNVVRAMIREIDADCYILVDGDDTYPAEAAPAMVAKVLDEGYDMVDGDRLSTTYFTENKRPFHNFGNKLVRDLINTLFDSHVRDIMTGYRVMSFGFAKTLPILSHGFELETEMTIHALDKNVRVLEMPIEYRDRPAGSSSKLNTVSDGIKVVWSIFNLMRSYRPLLFYFILGLICLVIGGACDVTVVSEVITTHYIPNMSTFVIGSTLLVLAVTFFAAGFVLSSVARRNRQDFEITLNQVVWQWRHRSDAPTDVQDPSKSGSTASGE